MTLIKVVVLDWKLCIFSKLLIYFTDKEESAITTIMIRGSTDNIMDDMERAINDGVNTYKALTRDNRLVPGGGATEIELAKQITTLGESTPGLEQYAIKKFAEALEVVPRTIAENAGVKVISFPFHLVHHYLFCLYIFISLHVGSLWSNIKNC